jgi:predicted 3-demethylubiquinone-9 3-methyltransferase (glyoxalase superfamily)
VLSVNCETQEEVGELGEVVGRGKKDRCGWLKDKSELSWQIIPSALGRLMGDNNAAKAQSVMKAVLQMDKIDIARLQQAYDQA